MQPKSKQSVTIQGKKKLDLKFERWSGGGGHWETGIGVLRHG
jgi:hypothetical protein